MAISYNTISVHIGGAFGRENCALVKLRRSLVSRTVEKSTGLNTRQEMGSTRSSSPLGTKALFQILKLSSATLVCLTFKAKVKVERSHLQCGRLSGNNIDLICCLFPSLTAMEARAGVGCGHGMPATSDSMSIDTNL